MRGARGGLQIMSAVFRLLTWNIQFARGSVH